MHHIRVTCCVSHSCSSPFPPFFLFLSFFRLSTHQSSSYNTQQVLDPNNHTVFRKLYEEGKGGGYFKQEAPSIVGEYSVLCFVSSLLRFLFTSPPHHSSRPASHRCHILCFLYCAAERVVLHCSHALRVTRSFTPQLSPSQFCLSNTGTSRADKVVDFHLDSVDPVLREGIVLSRRCPSTPLVHVSRSLPQARTISTKRKAQT